VEASKKEEVPEIPTDVDDEALEKLRRSPKSGSDGSGTKNFTGRGPAGQW